MGGQYKNILTREDFENILGEKVVTIIKASAEWCEPCKRIVDYVDKLFGQMSSNVQMIYLDVDESSELSDFLHIRKLPTFISYVGRDRMDILEGGKEENVKQFFQKVELHARFLQKI